MEHESWSDQLRGRSWSELEEELKKSLIYWSDNNVEMAEAFVAFQQFKSTRTETYHKAEKALDWKRLEAKMNRPEGTVSFWKRTIPLYQAVSVAAILLVAMFFINGFEQKSTETQYAADTTSSVRVGDWNDFQKAFVVPLP